MNRSSDLRPTPPTLIEIGRTSVGTKFTKEWAARIGWIAVRDGQKTVELVSLSPALFLSPPFPPLPVHSPHPLPPPLSLPPPPLSLSLSLPPATLTTTITQAREAKLRERERKEKSERGRRKRKSEKMSCTVQSHQHRERVCVWSHINIKIESAESNKGKKYLWEVPLTSCSSPSLPPSILLLPSYLLKLNSNKLPLYSFLPLTC